MPKNPKRRAVLSRSPFVFNYLCGCRGCFYVAFTAPSPARYALPSPPIAPGAHCGRLSPCSGTGVPPVFALAGDRGVPPFKTSVAGVAGVVSVVSVDFLPPKEPALLWNLYKIGASWGACLKPRAPLAPCHSGCGCMILCIMVRDSCKHDPR